MTAFLEKRLFTEGAEVKQGDLLYRLERGPFEADVQAKRAAIQQVEAQLRNANLTLDRAQELLRSTSGTQVAVDAAEANQQALMAQLLAAQAQLRQSEINLAYTEIHAPIDGKIGRTTTTEGNVVSPGSGVAVDDRQPGPDVRRLFRSRANRAGSATEDRRRGRLRCGQGPSSSCRTAAFTARPASSTSSTNSVTAGTDTLLLRAEIANPSNPGPNAATGPNRELIDWEFVNVLLEGAQPIDGARRSARRRAVRSAGRLRLCRRRARKAQRPRIQLGQSTPTSAAVLSGLQEGER